MAGFAQHLFISYAHIDNQPMTSGEEGWISRFHEALEAALSSRMGRPARIWRDKKLQGNDVFSDEILEQFEDTAVLLSVVSPRYINSEWCTREISSFCKTAERDGGVVVGDNKARLFKVVKIPVDSEEDLPEIAQQVLGYQFYTYQNEVPLELDAAYGEKFGQDYRLKVVQLAHNLSGLLNQLDAEGQTDMPQESEADQLTVYLAECSYDQRESRESLQGELQLHGYKVLPDRSMPREENDYKQAVQSMLASSAFSIHLIGDTYGAVPDGPAQKSVTEIQNELAAQNSIDRSEEFRRIIWLPRGSRSDHSQQQAFIDALHRDAVTQFGADLITADLEALKASVLGALEILADPEQQPAEAASAATENDNKLVYLFCDKRDRDSKAILPLRKYLREQGFDVAIPAFEGKATEVRENHQQLLKLCAIVILFYGAGDEAWKRNFDIDLKKMPGYRDNKPPPIIYSYLAGSRTADKSDLIDLEEPNLIDGFDEFSPASLQPLLEAINASGAIT